MLSRLRSYLSGSGLGPLLIKAVTGSAGLRIAGMGFGFLVGVQLARGLGPEGYGIYGVAMSIIALLTVPTEFGLPQLLTREVAAAQVNQDWGRMKGILQWSSRVSMVMAGAVGLAVVAWLLLSGTGLGSSLGMTLLAGVAMIPVVAQLSMRSAALRGLQQIVKGQLPDVLLRPMLYSLFLFMAPLWFVSLDPAIVMVLGVISAALALVVAWYMLGRATPAIAETARVIIDSRSWWASALPMALTEGMRLLQGHLLILLLGWMVVMSEVGVYRVASSMMLLVAMPISLFNIVSMPLISRLHASGDIVRLRRMLGVVAIGMTLGVVGLSVPFFIAGGWLLGILFGEEFTAGGKVLSILCSAVIVNALFGMTAATLNMTGHQKCVTRASFIALVILFFSAIPLVLFFGVIGAAMANVISLVVWNFLMWRDAIVYARLDTSVIGVFRKWIAE